MNYKAILIAAVLVIALCTPALAESSPGVWSNGNFYTNEQWAKMSGGSDVVYSPYSDVTSKYRDNNPANTPEVFVGANTCTLEGNVRAGYNTLTKEVLIANVLAPNDTMVIPILPDGTFRYEGLAQGKYILKILPQFEGLGPEQVSSVTCNHGVARPESELLGFAISTVPSTVCSREILKASYGAFKEVCYPEVSHMVHHDATVRLANRICWPVFDYEMGHVHAKKVGSYSPHDFVYHGDRYQITGSRHDTAFMVILAWDEKVVDQEAYCEQVGGYADVTSNVREALATGHTSFLFNNEQNPGGIFDITTTTLLSEISPDPAPGIVKHVSIDYKDCNGMEQHVSTEEYEVINL